MATITTDTYLDGGTARTAGEAWTMNGGVLTIRTDTRWHANAPASMLGSIGATTQSATLGGGVLIDSRNVRWMPYDTGSGNVPAIGTTVTQGGVSGYLLGVWSSYTSAPTAVGAPVPATGYIKFREVTGGVFAVGALTGIGASATSADRQGWIEVTQEQAVANTVPRLGFFRTRGGWFELDQVTSGLAGDVIQIPTNGGGANTHVPAVWIETGVGTNEYEIYPALMTTWFIAANLDTDIRDKFVQTIGNGQVRIGQDSAVANAGYVPPAGCRIRIPSNIGHQTTSANRALNLFPHATVASRPDFTTTASGAIDFEYFLNDWYHLFSAAFQVRMINVATFDVHSSSNEGSATELDNYAMGATIIGQTLTLTNNSLGGTMTDCRFVRPDALSNGHSMVVTGCSNYTITNVRTGVVQYARSTGGVVFSQCRNLVIDGMITYCATLVFTTCSNVVATDLNYIDRLKGVTNATIGKYAVQCTVSCDNITIDGMILSYAGELGPYLGVYNSSNSSNLTFRNLGTRAVPVDINASAAPAYIYQDSGNNDGVRVQRCYLETTRTSNFLTVNTSKNITLESCSGTVGSVQTLSLNTQLKGIRTASNSVTGGASVYGSHTFDLFTSDTVGRIWWAMNEPTAFSNSFVTLTLAGSTGGFTSGGQVSMPTSGDELIIETPYYILGHTGFANSAATLTGTGTGNFTYEYAIDINDGNGFGSYQTLDGTNLSAETISPSLGFKLRLKITCTSTVTTNAITYVRIVTDSTAVAQDNLYPLDTAPATFGLTGLEIGSEVVVFDDTYTTELKREVITGTTFDYNYTWISDIGNFDINFVVWKDDKQIIKTEGITLTNVDQSIPLVQVDDLLYTTSRTDTPLTLNYTSKLIIMDTGTVIWNVPEVYSRWKDDVLLTNNSQYAYAFAIVGGNVISGIKSIPQYTFLTNAWQGRPQEANHTLNVTNGVIVATGDPFVNTLGAFTVRINYEQPVQAITVSTAGSLSPTQQQIRDAMALATGATPAVGSLDDKIDGATAPTVADIWSELVPGAYNLGEAGYVLGSITGGAGGGGGQALNAVMQNFILTTGIETGSYIDTTSPTLASHTLDDVGNDIDGYYITNIGLTGRPASVNFNANVQSGNDSVDVYQWDFVGAQWISVGTIPGSGSATLSDYSFPLISSLVGTGANAGEVRIRVFTTGGSSPRFDNNYMLMSYIDIAQTYKFIGVAQGGGVNTITFPASASGSNNLYFPGLVVIRSGTGAGQSARLESYDGATKIGTVATNWTIQPDATSLFTVEPWGSVRVSDVDDKAAQDIAAGMALFQGTATAGSSTTITLPVGADTNDQFYRPALVVLVGGMGEGQSARITDYNGTTRVATIASTWTVPPDNTTEFILMPWATVRVSEMEADVEAEIADAVWDEATSGHTTAGTTGKTLSDAKAKAALAAALSA